MSITAKKIINSTILLAFTVFIIFLAYYFTGIERRMLMGSILGAAVPDDIASIEFVTPKGIASPINNVVTIEGVFIQYNILPPIVNVFSVNESSIPPYMVGSGAEALLRLVAIDNLSGVLGCRFSNSDMPYDSMANNCPIEDSISNIYLCNLGELPDGDYTFYYSCKNNKSVASITNSVDFMVSASL